MRVVAVGRIFNDFFFRVQDELRVPLFELLNHLIYSIDLLLGILQDITRLEYVVMMDYLNNGIEGDFRRFDRETSVAQLFHELFNCCKYILSVLWQEVFEPLSIRLLRFYKLFDSIDGLLENEGLLNRHKFS